MFFPKRKKSWKKTLNLQGFWNKIDIVLEHVCLPWNGKFCFQTKTCGITTEQMNFWLFFRSFFDIKFTRKKENNCPREKRQFFQIKKIKKLKQKKIFLRFLIFLFFFVSVVPKCMVFLFKSFRLSIPQEQFTASGFHQRVSLKLLFIQAFHEGYWCSFKAI